MLIKINDCNKNHKEVSNRTSLNKRSNCLYFNLVICSIIKNFTSFNNSLTSLQPKYEHIF